jgi:quercetin dioxygenase-like cupin family protein
MLARMATFDEVARMGPQPIWDGVSARVVHGERITMGVVELDPGAVVPEHRHEQEQLGVVVRGSLRFRIGGETRELGPGATYRILSNEPHEAHAGPDGAVVIDVFSPLRDDWKAVEAQAPRPPRWP